MRLADLAQRRVGVLGYGREGVTAVAVLRHTFPDQAVTVFSESEVSCGSPGVEMIIGPLDAKLLARCEVLIRSPGVSIYREEVEQAVALGTCLTSGTALWFAEPRTAKVVAITGSKGKSTTSALVQFLLTAAGQSAVLAGNIGVPLLEFIAPVAEPDIYVVELSSYQVVDCNARPAVAVLTNLVPEHLDWHGGVERYYRDKLKLFANPAASCLVNGGDPRSLAHTRNLSRQLFNHSSGWQVKKGGLVAYQGCEIDTIRWQLVGQHNAVNLSAALATVQALGVDPYAGLARIEKFRGLPHRLQVVAEHDGVTIVDDSMATTPYATIAALESFVADRVSVLVGGYDRGLDWRPFAEWLTHTPVSLVICRGDNGPRIAALLRRSCPQQPVAEIASLSEAVRAGFAMTPRPGVLLLSPGAPSFGEFRDYRERGRAFTELAMAQVTS